MPFGIRQSSRPQWDIDAEERHNARIRHAATAALEMPITAPPVDIMDVGDGALRMMQRYAVETAFSPQPLLAVAGGIVAVGAAAGRRYASPSGLRTNVFAIAIGESGSGKDQARRCIRRVFKAAGIFDTYLGGRKIASDQAIFSALEHHPVKLFLLNEFGHLLAALKGKNAAAYQASILSTLTELFTSAGEDFHGTEYAKVNRDEAGSVIPTPTFQKPHICVYGDTVAPTLWGATENGALGDGSLARYLCFKTEDDNPRPNPSHADIDEALPPDLVEYIRMIARGVPGHDYGGNLAGVMNITTDMKPYRVGETEDAKALREALALRQWQWKGKLIASKKPTSFVARYGEHVGTLSMIRAIARSPELPVITDADMAWGEAVARHCIGTVMGETDANVASSPAEASEKRFTRALEKALREAQAVEISRTDLGTVTRFLGRRQRDDMIGDLVEREVLLRRQAEAEPPSKKGTTLYQRGPNWPADLTV